MKIAIQGIEGCFHQIAANNYFNTQVDVLCCTNFQELVNQVLSRKHCKIGIMAIENSIAGSILQNYKLLQAAQLEIIGEVYLPITQNLIGIPGAKIEDIHEVLSHPMAIYQCSEFLSNLKNVKLIETEDTAASVKKIKDNQWKDKVAISSSLSASLYDMEILASSIETNKENYTRFLIISTQNKIDLNLTNKASLYFSVNNSKGSLAEILDIIATYNINLSKLQSYPIMGIKWHYYFYVDLEYDNYQNYKDMIEKIKPRVKEVSILGNYKRGAK